MIRRPPRSTLFPYPPLFRPPPPPPPSALQTDRSPPARRRACAGHSPVLSGPLGVPASGQRSEEHTSELQSQSNIVCRLLLEKKKNSSHRAPANHNALAFGSD